MYLNWLRREIFTTIVTSYKLQKIILNSDKSWLTVFKILQKVFDRISTTNQFIAYFKGP